MSRMTPDQADVLRLGLFGGTFDPPHAGHLAAARTVLQALNLDRVDLVPANEPWQKADRSDTVTPAEVRLEMVRALVKGVEGLGVDDREIRRGGPTYTVDTLREIRSETPAAEIYLIVGADTAARISTWREADEVMSLSTLVIVNRGDEHPTEPRGASKVRIVQMDPVNVSSTAVRAEIAVGHDVADMVTAPVMDVISAHHLYSGNA